MERTLHDLITTFTRSLMLEQSQIPVSLAAKWMQFASELAAWLSERQLNAAEPAEPDLKPTAPEPLPGLAAPMLEQLAPAVPVPLTTRGTVPVSRQDANAKRRAAWTPEKRRQARDRAIARGLGQLKPLPDHTNLYPSSRSV